MWSIELSFFTFTAVIVHGVCARSHFMKHSLHTRNLITPDALDISYDYIIAGGGLAGLAIASRLSEDSSKSVLVLEAGDSGSAIASQIDIPSGAYYTSVVGTSYDWQHVTVPQTNISDRIVGWPRGKILGGSSAMNAMYLVRPSATDFDAWESIISQDENAKNWGWDEMYPAMRKSETFTPPLDTVQQTGNIQYNASAYGTSGPMNVSYPGIMMAINGNWTKSLEAVGIPTLQNPNAGVSLGGYIAPSSINPFNWTRSYSKPAYIDNLPPRSNLHILTNATVLRVNFNDLIVNGKWFASSVSFAADSTDTVRTVAVVRDVILAGGPLGSPKILMHSGVGPRDVLEAAGVDVVYELPGVGQNLQDHVTAAVVWESPLETAGNIQQSGSDFSRTPEFLSFINDAVAFVNASTLFGDDAAALLHTAIINDLEQSAATLVPSQYSQVIEGYKAIYNATTNLTIDSAQLEMLMSVMSPGTIAIQAALQHPLSHGRVYINSSNPFDPIIVDPQYLSHWADVVTLRQGIKLVRTVGQAFGASFGPEISPGSAIQTDDQIEAWLRSSGVGTQYHPIATCSMLSESQGGVVNNLLQVYGLVNVRVADSSVYPFEFAAHLGSVTYGLAEQASTLFSAESGSLVMLPSIKTIIVISVVIQLLR